RVVSGIGEPRHVLIGGVAEHQRHALAGKGRSAGEQQQGGEEDFVKSAQTHDGVSKTTALPPREYPSKAPLRSVVRQITKELPRETEPGFPEVSPDVRSHQQRIGSP